MVRGRIVDSRTCTPVRYANVMVANTTVGTMTTWNGTYCIDHVPAGGQTLRVRSLVCQPIDSAVTVIASNSITVDFETRPAWSDAVPRKPSIRAPRCPEHAARMKFVLVPAGVVELNILPGSHNGEASPYAWPVVGGSESGVPLKVNWGPICPKCVGAWNAESSHERWEGLVSDSPGKWKNYIMAGIADFMAPRGLVDSVVVDSCTQIGTWRSDDLRIEICRVAPSRDVFTVGRPGPGTPAQARGDYVVFEPLGDCKASIVVAENDDHCRLNASIASTTSSADNLDIKVIAHGRHASRAARTILGTMLFPALD
jgi:hypothetical protein